MTLINVLPLLIVLIYVAGTVLSLTILILSIQALILSIRALKKYLQS